ncbi:leucyl aminopeptidase [Prolixibacteraceae bacterium]|nr:leucyl aminopeptidase [Prolixibacteraceae bacterium]
MKNILLVAASDLSKDQVVLFPKEQPEVLSQLDENQIIYIKNQLDKEQTIIGMPSCDGSFQWMVAVEKSDDCIKMAEALRQLGAKVVALIKGERIASIGVKNQTEMDRIALPFVEGMVLADYKFEKYFTKKEEYPLCSIEIDDRISEEALLDLTSVLKATIKARDLVNEPQSFLTATQLSEEMIKMGEEANISVTVLGKKKIEELGMGGLLGVNKGSVAPPTFTIMEYKPKGAVNSEPIVFVGKGVVYDTGGLSLKPTAASMDYMKSDMGGAAAVSCATYAIALAKLPYHVITLVPATDNRPSGDAYAPGDVLKMYNGKTVEVLNTDAEGRLILADALSYADRYKPEVVMDVATLTGAAAIAIGTEGAVIMGNAKETYFEEIDEAGFATHERSVRFPFWDEYSKMLESDIADLKNLGGREAGAITAGKFLENFTESPYIHLDIAGPAFLHSEKGYIKKGGSGYGVRLLFEWIKTRAK